MPVHFHRAVHRLAVLTPLACALAAPVAQGRCVDETLMETPPAAAMPAPVPAGTSRQLLQGLVQTAIRRSNSVGAARLLAEAAADDVGEARAGGLPQASLSTGIATLGSSGPDVASVHGVQGHAGINISAPLYDGGRIAELTGWRKNLAEAARLGQVSAQEEIGLQTVSLALERGRYEVQAKVYRQYGSKMGCLVEALQQIVNADPGRASELVQAQKTVQQVRLSQDQTAASLRQVETRLRRFVGNELPDTEGLSSVLLELPPLDEAEADAARAADIVALDAQAEASASFSRAVAAGQKPQVNWVVGGNLTTGVGAGVGSGRSVSAGVNVNIPLYSPADTYTANAARRRADAARLQVTEATLARRFRVIDAHEQASASFDRARQVIGVVRTSNQVRNFTLQQWQQLGRRSLFDVMAAEGDHYNLRIAYVNALYDGEQSVALLRSLGTGLAIWLQ